MKLSKAQQDVVDKMRDGWLLYSPFLLKKDGERQWIRYATYQALDQKGVIEKIDKTNNVYQLTEKYRQ